MLSEESKVYLYEYFSDQTPYIPTSKIRDLCKNSGKIIQVSTWWDWRKRVELESNARFMSRLEAFQLILLAWWTEIKEYNREKYGITRRRRPREDQPDLLWMESLGRRLPEKHEMPIAARLGQEWFIKKFQDNKYWQAILDGQGDLSETTPITGKDLPDLVYELVKPKLPKRPSESTVRGRWERETGRRYKRNMKVYPRDLELMVKGWYRD